MPATHAPRSGRARRGRAALLFVVLVAGVIALVLARSGSEDIGGSSGTEQLKRSAFSTRTYDRFSIDVPRSWLLTEREDYRGSFFRTRWRRKGTRRVFALVDYTPGYSGSALEGARSVRAMLRTAPGYVEHSFRPVTAGGKQMWRWEFTKDGVRKVDYFASACGTGYAFLGAATPRQFEARYRKTFARMARSLAPRC